MKKFLLFLSIFFLFPLISFAKDESFYMVCDNTKYNVGDQFICRISVNTDFSFDKITFDVSTGAGLSIDAVRSNHESLWSLTSDKSTITAQTKKSEIETGLQEFGILLIDATESGLQNIDLTNITLTNTTDNTTKTFDDINTQIKVISNCNTLSSIKINGKSIDNFSSTLDHYTINANDEDSINVEATPTNEFATVIGIGDLSLEENSAVLYFPITVTSESGSNKIYTIIVKKNNFVANNLDKSLKSLSLKDDKGNSILFNFKSGTYDYYINVDSDVTSIDVIPELNDESSQLVKNYGKQTVKLNDGNNPIMVKIKDTEGQILTYVLNVTRPISDLSSDSYLKSLRIENFSLSFNKKVKSYTLYVTNGTKKLNINATPNDDSSTVAIQGNSDLQDGSVIKIIVTAENESKTTYQITIKYKEKSYLWILISITVFILTLGLGYFLYKKKSKNIKKKPIKKKKPKKEIKTKYPSKPISKVNQTKKKVAKKKTTKKKPVKKKSKTQKSKQQKKKTNKKSH